MAWSPLQYVKFEDERTRPARDLLAQVPLRQVFHGFDLGCGPGNSTQLLIERFGPEAISGVDSDAAMIEAARQRLPDTHFELADLSVWRPPRQPDLLFANAVFQWLPDHVDILEHLMDSLVPGGVLAVQMPDNLSEPSHLLMEETCRDAPWRAAFSGRRIRRNPLPPTSHYYERLKSHATRIDIWHTIYNHPLADAGEIVEWVRSTGLRPYLEALEPHHHDEFLADYTARIARAYPAMAGGGVLFRFPRMFIVAVKG